MGISVPWDIRERSFRFACDIVLFCLAFGQKPGCSRIADQLIRAGTGVGANTEEAKSAYSRREFALKNSYALKEAREAQFWLRLILECHLSDEARQTTQLLKESGALVGILTATVRSARQAAKSRTVRSSVAG